MDYSKQNLSICVEKIDGLTYFNLMKLKHQQLQLGDSQLDLNISNLSLKNPINQIKLTSQEINDKNWEFKGKFLNQYLYVHRYNNYADNKLPIAMFSYGVQNLFEQSIGPKRYKLLKLRQKIEVLDTVQINKLQNEYNFNVNDEITQNKLKSASHELFWFGSVHYDEWKSTPTCINLMDYISDQYKLKSFLLARNTLWILSAISSLIIGIIFPVLSIYVEIIADIDQKIVKKIQKYNLWATAIFGAILVPLAGASAYNAYMKKDYFKDLSSLQCSTLQNNLAFQNVAKVIAKSFKDNLISILFIIIGQLINLYLFRKRKQQLKQMLNYSMQKIIAQQLKQDMQSKDEGNQESAIKGGFMSQLIQRSNQEEEKGSE